MFNELVSSLRQMKADCRFDLAVIEADAMTFLNGLGQHALDDPEPIFAILRSFRPVLLVSHCARRQ